MHDTQASLLCARRRSWARACRALQPCARVHLGAGAAGADLHGKAAQGGLLIYMRTRAVCSWVQVLLEQIYETKPHELSQVLWGYGRLRVPGAPGKVFLEAATDALNSSMVGVPGGCHRRAHSSMVSMRLS